MKFQSQPYLSEARNRLVAMAFQERWNYRQLADHLETLAYMSSQVSKPQLRELAAQLHDCAGKLPYVDDYDYGALVLENASDSVTETDLRL